MRIQSQVIFIFRPRKAICSPSKRNTYFFIAQHDVGDVGGSQVPASVIDQSSFFAAAADQTVRKGFTESRARIKRRLPFHFAAPGQISESGHAGLGDLLQGRGKQSGALAITSHVLDLSAPASGQGPARELQDQEQDGGRDQRGQDDVGELVPSVEESIVQPRPAFTPGEEVDGRVVESAHPCADQQSVKEWRHGGDDLLRAREVAHEVGRALAYDEAQYVVVVEEGRDVDQLSRVAGTALRHLVQAERDRIAVEQAHGPGHAEQAHQLLALGGSETVRSVRLGLHIAGAIAYGDPRHPPDALVPRFLGGDLGGRATKNAGPAPVLHRRARFVVVLVTIVVHVIGVIRGAAVPGDNGGLFGHAHHVDAQGDAHVAGQLDCDGVGEAGPAWKKWYVRVNLICNEIAGVAAIAEVGYYGMESLHRLATSLGHQGGEEFSEKGPNFWNHVQWF